MKSFLMKLVPLEIIELAAELTAPHSDGYLKKGVSERLKALLESKKTQSAARQYIKTILAQNPI